MNKILVTNAAFSGSLNETPINLGFEFGTILKDLVEVISKYFYLVICADAESAC